MTIMMLIMIQRVYEENGCEIVNPNERKQINRDRESQQARLEAEESP